MRIQKQAGKLMWADELLRGVEGWQVQEGKKVRRHSRQRERPEPENTVRLDNGKSSNVAEAKDSGKE